jgi:predicted amidohydrolase
LEKRKNEELRFKGNSAIYDYSGRQMKKAGKDKDKVLLAEIYPASTRNKSFNPINDVLTDRQPQHYIELAKIVK